MSSCTPHSLKISGKVREMLLNIVEKPPKFNEDCVIAVKVKKLQNVGEMLNFQSDERELRFVDRIFQRVVDH